MNILPIASSRWTMTNCTMSDLTFNMLEDSSAVTSLTPDDIANLSAATISVIVLSGEVSPFDITCSVDIDGLTKYTCFLTAHTNGLYKAVVDLPSSFTTLTISLHSTVQCELQHLLLNIDTQSYEEVIKELQDALPRVLQDYNVEPVIVTEEEDTIALINARLLSDTIAEGHLTFSYSATQSTRLTIRIYDTWNKELYTPMQIDVIKGKHVFSLPHAYLNRLTGRHTFYVTAQVSTGTVTIDTRGILYNMLPTGDLQNAVIIKTLRKDLVRAPTTLLLK